MKTTKVVIVESEKQPYTSEIPADLDAYQQIVGGWIEIVRPFSDNVCIVCNEEGKILLLDASFLPLRFYPRNHCFTSEPNINFSK